MENKIIIGSHGESGKAMVKELKQIFGDSVTYMDRLDLEVIRQNVEAGNVTLFIGTKLFGDIAIAAEGEGCINLTYVDAKDNLQLDSVITIVGMLQDVDQAYDMGTIRTLANEAGRIITAIHVKDAKVNLVKDDMLKLLRYFPPIALASTRRAILSFVGNVTAEQVQEAVEILSKQLPKNVIIYKVLQKDDRQEDTCTRSILLFS